MKNEPVSGGTLDGLDMGCLMQVPVPSHTANIVVSIGIFLRLVSSDFHVGLRR